MLHPAQVLNHLDGTRDPLPGSTEKFYLLIETTGSHSTQDKYAQSIVHILI